MDRLHSCQRNGRGEEKHRRLQRRLRRESAAIPAVTPPRIHGDSPAIPRRPNARGRGYPPATLWRGVCSYPVPGLLFFVFCDFSLELYLTRGSRVSLLCVILMEVFLYGTSNRSRSCGQHEPGAYYSVYAISRVCTMGIFGEHGGLRMLEDLLCLYGHARLVDFSCD
jgi:hypothetical protein